MSGEGRLPTGPTAAPEGTGDGGEEPEQRRRLGWAGLGVAALGLVLGLVTAGLLGGLWAAARGLSTAQAERDLGIAAASSLGLWVGFVGLPLAWSQRHGGPVRRLGLGARWTDVPLGLAVGLVSTVATGLVASIVLDRAERDALEATATKVVDRAQGGVAVILLVVLLCVLTPIAEEVFFRGLLFRSLGRVAPAAAAATVAGLLFGLLHYDDGPARGAVVATQLGLLALFGVVLCLLVQRTGRLGAGIVAHATFNAVTVFTLLARR